MPRPKTKQELLDLGAKNYQILIEQIDSLTPAQQEATFDFNGRDQNIRDLLIHLYEWHQLVLAWEKANAANQEKQFLREGYNWKTYPQMNVEIWEEHQKTSLPQAKKLLEKSHHDVAKLIDKYSDKELFTKKYYTWTGNSSLGSYLVSATSSHYDWASKELKKYLKSLGS